MATKKKATAKRAAAGAVKAPCGQINADGVCVELDRDARCADCSWHASNNPKATNPPPLMVWREIGVNGIYESPYQTRRDHGDLEGLAASIRQHGLLNPVTVREMGKGANTGADAYEMIAGHRRLKAAKLAGLATVPATVAECDDRTAAEMCVAENMQRQDLSPLEEAAGVAALIGTGHTPQDVADRLGRSRQWVARRAKLLELSEEAKAAYADQEHPFSRLPVEALEMIAALPRDAQEEELRAFSSSWSRPTVAAVRDHIETIIMMDLSKARFDTGACEKCRARTGCQPDLFDGGETCELGRCLNPECFKAKRDAEIRSVAAEIRDDNPDAKIISEDYRVRELTGAEVFWAHTKCKKSAPGAVRAFEIKGDGSVKSCWIEGETARGRGAQDEPKAAQPTAEQKRMAGVCLAMQARLETARCDDDHPFANRMTDVDILRTIAVTGTDDRWGYASPKAWEDRGDAAICDLRESLWLSVYPLLIARVKFGAMIRCEPAYREALEIGKRLFGMDKAEVDALTEAGT